MNYIDTSRFKFGSSYFVKLVT